MKNPILFMLASPTCPPGWHPVPGAAPPRSGDAVALVLSSLYPIRSMWVSWDQKEMLASCLPPEDYGPPLEAIHGKRDPVTFTETIHGFAFSVAALDFVRLAHPMVRWAPGGADGFRTVTEIDLLHGFVNGRCVACVCRMAPRSEAPCPA